MYVLNYGSPEREASDVRPYQGSFVSSTFWWPMGLWCWKKKENKVVMSFWHEDASRRSSPPQRGREDGGSDALDGCRGDDNTAGPWWHTTIFEQMMIRKNQMADKEG